MLIQPVQRAYPTPRTKQLRASRRHGHPPPLPATTEECKVGAVERGEYNTTILPLRKATKALGIPLRDAIRGIT